MGIDVPAGRVSVVMMISCPFPAGVMSISFHEKEPSLGFVSAGEFHSDPPGSSRVG